MKAKNCPGHSWLWRIGRVPEPPQGRCCGKCAGCIEGTAVCLRTIARLAKPQGAG